MLLSSLLSVLTRAVTLSVEGLVLEPRCSKAFDDMTALVSIFCLHPLCFWVLLHDSNNIVHVKGLAPIAALCVLVSLRGRAVPPLPLAGVPQKFITSLLLSVVQPLPGCAPWCWAGHCSLPCWWLKLDFQLVFLKVLSGNQSAISLFLQACSLSYWFLFRISQ